MAAFGVGCGLLAFGLIAILEPLRKCAIATFSPAALAGGFLLLLPETKGTEPEDLNRGRPSDFRPVKSQRVVYELSGSDGPRINLSCIPARCVELYQSNA
jgi:hypothetical protein